MTTFEGPAVDGVEGIGALTLPGLLDEVAGSFAGNEAVVFDDPLRDGATTRWTYAQLRREARTVARALVAAGVERGDAVGVLMGNRPEALASILAATLAGAIAVPMSTFAPRPELAHMLGLARVSVVLTQQRLLTRRFGDDVRALRLSPAFRGYRMSEVDWLIDQFAQILDDRDAELAALRGSAHPVAGAATKQSEEPPAGDETGDDEEHPHA
jgi:DivIVA domain-containing protein